MRDHLNKGIRDHLNMCTRKGIRDHLNLRDYHLNVEYECAALVAASDLAVALRPCGVSVE